VRKIWKVLIGAGRHAQEFFPELKSDMYPEFPDELQFFHAEEILEMYPDLPRKQRETAILKEHPAVFIIGIGQARTYMCFPRTAHLGEVTVTVCPDELKKICAEYNTHVLE